LLVVPLPMAGNAGLVLESRDMLSW